MLCCPKKTWPVVSPGSVQTHHQLVSPSLCHHWTHSPMFVFFGPYMAWLAFHPGMIQMKPKGSTGCPRKHWVLKEALGAQGSIHCCTGKRRKHWMQAKHEWHVWVANGSSINTQNALAQLIFCPMLPHSKCFQCLVLKWLAQTPSNFFSQISSNKASKQQWFFWEKSGCIPMATRLKCFGRMVSPLGPLSGLEPLLPTIPSW